MRMFSAKMRERFFSSVGTPTEAQRMGWQAISEGCGARISSPTGSGKTLAAFLYFLDGMRRELDALCGGHVRRSACSRAIMSAFMRRG